MPNTSPSLMRRALPILAVWAALAACLSALTTRVDDWYVMTDELLYERLAVSIAQGLSPLPRIHGELVPSFGQLYPLLVSPVFRHGSIPSDLNHAHLLNAWIMSSACIPASYLARRVTERSWAAYVTAVLSVGIPWMLYSSFLLTEVAAYPAFLWALLAIQRALAAPSRRGDLLALLAIGIAFLGRTQFVALLLVLPLALVTHHLGVAIASRPRRRVLDALRDALAEHRVLVVAYAVLAVAAAVLGAAGRLSSIAGIYRGAGRHGGGEPSAARLLDALRRAPRDVLARPRHPAVRGRHRVDAVEHRPSAAEPRPARLRMRRHEHRRRHGLRGDELQRPARGRVRPRPLPLLPRAAADPRDDLRPLRPTPPSLVCAGARDARCARVRDRRAPGVHLEAVPDRERGYARLRALPTARGPVRQPRNRPRRTRHRHDPVGSARAGHGPGVEARPRDRRSGCAARRSSFQRSPPTPSFACSR